MKPERAPGDGPQIGCLLSPMMILLVILILLAMAR